MTSGRKAVVLSIFLHGVFPGSMYTVGCTFAQPGRPVVIDFTLLDSGGTAPAQKETAAKQPAAPIKKPLLSAPGQEDGMDGSWCASRY